MALIKRIAVQGRATTGYTQGNVYIEALIGRSFTSQYSGNATANTPSGDSQKLKTTMASTLVNSIVAATTAAMTTVTVTLDSYPFATMDLDSSTIVVPLGKGNVGRQDLWRPDFAAGEWPLVLAANEGFVLRVTAPATGVATFEIGVEWLEVANF